MIIRLLKILTDLLRQNSQSLLGPKLDGLERPLQLHRMSCTTVISLGKILIQLVRSPTTVFKWKATLQSLLLHLQSKHKLLSKLLALQCPCMSLITRQQAFSGISIQDLHMQPVRLKMWKTMATTTSNLFLLLVQISQQTQQTQKFARNTGTFLQLQSLALRRMSKSRDPETLETPLTISFLTSTIHTRCMQWLVVSLTLRILLCNWESKKSILLSWNLPRRRVLAVLLMPFQQPAPQL